MAATKTKPVGRAKGSKNKRTQAIEQLLEEKFPGWNPIVQMAAMANDESLPNEIRMSALKEVSQYVAPKRKAIEMSGTTGVHIKLTDLTGAK